MKLSTLYVHPVKSVAALAVDAVEAEPRGPRDDRRWMLVDAAGRFVTGRQLGALVRLRARPRPGGLLLQWGAQTREVAAPAGEHGRLAVTVWSSTVDAACADPAVSAWVSDCLGQPLQLVHMDAQAQRWAAPEYAGDGVAVGFADGYPWLLIGQASLDALNARLAQPVAMTAFRPNLVVSGAPPHAEDGWRRLRIGSVEFRVVKPCTRCVFTTVDPDSGERRADGEPLATLKGYRRSGSGITFGMSLVADGRGTLRVGDAVDVLD
jgi:uncharacterized protein